MVQRHAQEGIVTMKRKKSRKKKAKLTGMTVLLAAVSTCSYLFSALWMKSNNNQLAKEIQMYEKMIADIQKDNTTIYYEVTELSDRGRIMDIAEDAGLSINPNQVITITVQDDN
jgi:cell division protein FtsL